jgi:flagellar basal body-associated protein FliL
MPKLLKSKQFIIIGNILSVITLLVIIGVGFFAWGVIVQKLQSGDTPVSQITYSIIDQKLKGNIQLGFKSYNYWKPKVIQKDTIKDGYFTDIFEISNGNVNIKIQYIFQKIEVDPAINKNGGFRREIAEYNGKPASLVTGVINNQELARFKQSESLYQLVDYKNPILPDVKSASPDSIGYVYELNLFSEKMVKDPKTQAVKVRISYEIKNLQDATNDKQMLEADEIIRKLREI